MKAIPFDEASDIGFVHCEKFYPLHLSYHSLQSSSTPGEPPQQMAIQVEKK